MMRPVTSLALVSFILGALLAVAMPQTSQRRQHVRIAPSIPTAKRSPQLVFLEHADNLKRTDGSAYMVLTGNVEFSKGGMRMYTDSAHYYDADGSFNAFGNVRMEQGDTLFIYADELNYDGTTEVAYLFGYNGQPVRLINRDVKLETDVFTYDMPHELCYYTTGGVLTDRDNRLESIEGEYSPATKEANFYENVILTSRSPQDELRMVGNALYYNTLTHVAEFNDPTVITNKDGRIDSDEGVYNTETRIAELYAHSVVTTNRGSTLEGDTLFYDRAAGWGEAFGNMALVDTVQKSILYGDYGYYNELADSAFVTGNALGKEYSQGDTLFIHGRYLTSVRRIDTRNRIIGTDTVQTVSAAQVDTVMLPDSVAAPLPAFTINELTEEYQDTTHIITAWPRVRFFRSDMQGLCDSLVFTQADTMVRMFHHPVVWSEDRQIFGNLIEVHLNDSTIDRADLPDFGFMAQLIEGDFYNQLTGKSMTAWFTGGELERMLVSGSVDGIVFPEENDSTVNKLVNFKTANLEGWFTQRNMDRMKMWPETSGEAIPLYLAKFSDLHLPQFKWFAGMRPESPQDVFVIPPEMESLMSDRPIPVIRYRRDDDDQAIDTDADEGESEPATDDTEAQPLIQSDTDGDTDDN